MLVQYLEKTYLESLGHLWVWETCLGITKIIKYFSTVHRSHDLRNGLLYIDIWSLQISDFLPGIKLIWMEGSQEFLQNLNLENGADFDFTVAHAVEIAPFDLP